MHTWRTPVRWPSTTIRATAMRCRGSKSLRIRWSRASSTILTLGQEAWRVCGPRKTLAKRSSTPSCAKRRLEPAGTGHASLCHRWVDEDFDPSQHAYYYVRVLENPTCRWSVLQCLENGYDCESPTTNLDRDCCDPVVGLNRTACDNVACENTDLLTEHEARCCVPPVELTIQERAWTSAIWYAP